LFEIPGNISPSSFLSSFVVSWLIPLSCHVRLGIAFITVYNYNYHHYYQIDSLTLLDASVKHSTLQKPEWKAWQHQWNRLSKKWEELACVHALYCLSHTSSPFCSGYFGDGSLANYFSASQLARITGMSCQCPVRLKLIESKSPWVADIFYHFLVFIKEMFS
jgi:hypothetical protein